MKRHLYILATAALLLVGCSTSDVDSSLSGDGLNVPGDGKVTLAFDLKLQGAKVQAVESRATAWASKENVSKIKGAAFVFSTNASGVLGDDSKLLQKVDFKTVNGKIYITFDEYDAPCYIRLMTSMTDGVGSQINGFVSQKDIDKNGASGPATTFADYKHISVDLSGYYASATAPDPNDLTKALAFPLASHGVNMDGGLNDDSVAALNPNIFMIPVAAKLDVESKCGFELQEVTLLNGAMKARMRSSVVEDDGVTPISSLPLPINLGGVVKFAAVAASGNTTAATPIYFFPNEGSGPFDAPEDPANEYPANGTKLSDEINGVNPTYIIVKGKAAGYNVEGYYKIPIAYHAKILADDGSTTEQTELTYDIVRNNHYMVKLIKVDNPGYVSFDEAVAGPANDISFSINIDGGNTSADDTFTDPRAETIVAHNGFYYVELVGSEIYAQGYGAAGVEGEFGLSLTRNINLPDGYSVPDLTISATSGITITSAKTISAGSAGKVKFTATKSGTITLRCGDMLKEIPVSYAPTPVYDSGSTTVGGSTFPAAGSFAADSADVNDTGMFTDEQYYDEIAANTTYRNREFRGKVYPEDMSLGIRKVYVKQASNFDLSTYYDNTSAGLGGNTGTNNIFKTTSTSTLKDVYEADINYQSTGKVYQVNKVDKGTLNGKGTMTNWWIGTAPIDFTASGQFTVDLSGAISTSFTKSNWSALTHGSTVTLDAGNIGSNQSGAYDSKKTQISNTATLTLANIAGQTKIYKFVLNQYAAPYIVMNGTNGVTYDSDEDAYYWTSTTPADCYGGWFLDPGANNNKGESLGNSPRVYNAHYIEGEQKDGGDFVWKAAPNKTDGYTGGADGLAAVKIGVAPQAANPSTNEWYFYGQVNDKSKDEGKWQAYFDLRITNDANEEIHFVITYRRDDDSQ